MSMQYHDEIHIMREFRETLGYLRGDLRYLLDRQAGLNYTIALLIGCGCEMLAAAEGDTKNRLGETVFAELLPAGDVQALATRLYSALRDGLAHGFDTKHIEVEGVEHQIHLTSVGQQDIRLQSTDRGVGLYIGVQRLAEALCAKITDFETKLRTDEGVRQRFMQARQPTTRLNTGEKAAWNRLLVAAGL